MGIAVHSTDRLKPMASLLTVLLISVALGIPTNHPYNHDGYSSDRKSSYGLIDYISSADKSSINLKGIKSNETKIRDVSSGTGSINVGNGSGSLFNNSQVLNQEEKVDDEEREVRKSNSVKKRFILSTTLNTARRLTRRDARMLEQRGSTRSGSRSKSSQPPSPLPAINSSILTPNVTIREAAGGGLEALVSWGSAEAGSLGVKRNYDIHVHWARTTCNYDTRWRHCNEPDMYAHRIVNSADQQVNLPGLTYNSRYWIQCESGHVKGVLVNFTTPPCPDPSTDFRSCTVVMPTTSVTSSRDHVFTPKITCLSYDSSHDVGVVGFTWPHHSDVIDEYEADKSDYLDDDYLIVHVDSSLQKRNRSSKAAIFEGDVDFNPDVSKSNTEKLFGGEKGMFTDTEGFGNGTEKLLEKETYQLFYTTSSTAVPYTSTQGSPTATAGSSSSSPGAENDWTSLVSVRYPTDQGVHMDMHRTSRWKMELELEPNRLHEIRIRASKDTKEIIYESLYVNVSRAYTSDIQHLKYPDCLLHKAPSMSELISGTSRPVSLVLISLVGLTLMVLATLTSLVLVRRCCRTYLPLKGSSLCKTISIRANASRSTPEESPCLSYKHQQQLLLQQEQLLQQSTSTAADSCELLGSAARLAGGSCGLDEWELDANEVTLGVELGQGAFGLVMTGLYRGKQVAIKVVKDDLSLGYREELLREIQLMKRLGSHPNIVSLIGACTIKEPIALIMEYLPYGNLQAFLQKCRNDGELQRSGGGCPTAVKYCPLDQYTGSSEYWSITATDILSFARQIAVAMEFLAERKYVHCDLAARNVLVGHGKVVKLCDFGLARLVHNGDQYYKLSNGRLPLKWMAVESIRDRVFTVQTDIWSYGVLLWEITTFGASPYSNIALVDLYRLLCNGYRLEQPENCSNELYDIMSQCWYEEPGQRTSFRDIRHQLENLLSQNCNYLTLEGLDCSTASTPSDDSAVTCGIRHQSTDGSDLGASSDIWRLSMQRLTDDSAMEGTSYATELDYLPPSLSSDATSRNETGAKSVKTPSKFFEA